MCNRIWQTDTTAVIKAIDLTIKLLSWTFPSGSHLITLALKSRAISPARAREVLLKEEPGRSEAGGASARQRHPGKHEKAWGQPSGSENDPG